MSKFPDPTKGFADQDPDVLLGMTCWGEGRNQPPSGIQAIACSVVNRMRLKVKTVAEIVLAPWQYDCFLPKNPNQHKLLDPVAYDSMGVWIACLAAAQNALNGQTPDTSDGATHYVTRNLWMRPVKNPHHVQWFEFPEIMSGRTKKTVVIGDHVFATAPF